MRPIALLCFLCIIVMDSNLTAGVFTSVFFHYPYDAFVFHLLKIIGLITVFQLPGK
jgi:hypothetical protein